MSEIHDLIAKVEAVHFRTHQDTGAGPNALLVWNHLRVLAGLDRLTKHDLKARARQLYLDDMARAFLRGDQRSAEMYRDAVKRLDDENTPLADWEKELLAGQQ